MDSIDSSMAPLTIFHQSEIPSGTITNKTMIRKIQPGASSNDVNFNPLIEEEPVTVKKRKRMN